MLITSPTQMTAGRCTQPGSSQMEKWHLETCGTNERKKQCIYTLMTHFCA